MSLEINGKVVQILKPQTGNGRNGVWTKQDFIIETKEAYPKKVCISAWGDKAKVLSQIPLESEVKVQINIESRSFNDKWYTDVRAWKIEVANGNEYNDNQDQATSYVDKSYDDVEGTTFTDETLSDDLPF